MAQLRQVPREIHKHIRARSYIGGSALGVSDGLVTNLAFLSGFAAIESDQDGRSYWTIVSSRRTNPSSSFSASHNSDARVARFRSYIGSVLVPSGSLEGARRRKETMEERTGNVSHRCSSRINPISNRWIPLIFLGLKKCSSVVFSGRFSLVKRCHLPWSRN